MRRLLAVLAILMLTLSACGSDGDGGGGAASDDDDAADTPAEAEAATELEVEAKDYAFAFDADTELAAGVVKIAMENTGEEDHQVQLVKLNTGKTYDQFTAAVATGKEAEVLAVGTLAGGPIAGPGGDQAVSVDLGAGSYAFVCLIPSPDGTPHAAKGMMAGPVTVVESDDPVEFSGKPDVTVTGTEYAFSEVKAFDGKGVIEFKNGGKEPHEAALISLNPGATPADIGKFFSGPPTGPPPFTVGGGLAVISPGTKGEFEVDLKAGDYVFACFVSAPDGAPHMAKGMLGAFTVT